jgi:hypothetical protein
MHIDNGYIDFINVNIYQPRLSYVLIMIWVCVCIVSLKTIKQENS